MAERVAPKRVSGKQQEIDQEDNGTDSHTEGDIPRGRVREPEGLPTVVGEENEIDDPQIHEVTMNILDQERKEIFTPVACTAFSHRARRRVHPESPVIRPAIVIAGQSEPGRRPQNQNRRRP
jgi:hypothetical protein